MIKLIVGESVQLPVAGGGSAAGQPADLAARRRLHPRVALLARRLQQQAAVAPLRRLGRPRPQGAQPRLQPPHGAPGGRRGAAHAHASPGNGLLRGTVEIGYCDNSLFVTLWTTVV